MQCTVYTKYRGNLVIICFLKHLSIQTEMLQLHNLIVAEHKMRDIKHVLPFPDTFISYVDYCDTSIVFRSTEHM